MGATEFMGDFVRRFGCTVSVIGGREFASMGQSSERGGACSACGDCDREYGVVGVAAEGVSIINTINGLHLSWDCPGCGRDTVEDTTLLESSAQAARCMADPLCFTCRTSA